MSKNLTVIPIPCLRDNYAYLLFSDQGNGSCLIIDACEAEPVRAELKLRGLVPAAILTTHHHWDHVGGNIRLAEEFGIPVLGHESELERIPAISRGLVDGETFSLAFMSGRVLHVPGHTQGAVSYLFSDICFTGDTLFCGGCGRLLEGTAAQLQASLQRLSSELDPGTQLYTGHEYTEANLKFATRFSDDDELHQRFAQVRSARALGRYCASASLKTELSTNLFLNCHRPEVQRAVWAESGSATETDAGCVDLTARTFVELRRLKDAS